MENEIVINYKLVSISTDPLIPAIRQTYEESFPVEERRDFHLIRSLIDTEPKFRMYALHTNDKYAGFISLWNLGDFAYVEHFAIDSSIRNSGIGRRALELIGDISDKPIVLEVEMPRDFFSVRRIAFYERLGYKLDDHLYFQPPYRLNEQPLEMRLMYRGKVDMAQDFERIKQEIYTHVYNFSGIKKAGL